MNYHEFKEQFEEVKRYIVSSHLDRILVKNTATNKLCLYEFYEYIDYSGNDLIYETYTKVDNEADGDSLNNKKDIRRTPYIRIMPDYTMIQG